MPRPRKEVPAYRLHKPRNQGKVVVADEVVYFPGPYNSAESQAAYRRWLAEYLATGRVRQQPSPTVGELVLAYSDQVVTPRFCRDGKETGESRSYRIAVRSLTRLTVNCRNKAGDMILKRQVSTEWARVRAFLAEVRERSTPEGGFVAIVEVCGFNDWFVKLLAEYGCREIIVVQPEKRSKKKTDRRDANALGELLWVNRQRLLAGKKVQGVRRVQLPSPQDAEDRQLTEWRKRLGQLRTRTTNRIKHLLRKHNVEQECPTKGLGTIKGREWLGQVALGTIDRLEMDQLLAQWKLWDEQIAKVAVMRRLTTVIWHMVKHNEPYANGGPPRRRLARKAA